MTLNQYAPITRFAFMRHALTEWNKVKKIQGQTDTILAPEGLRQAVLWARRLSTQNGHLPLFDRLLCSDLSRARKTADIINEALGLPLHTDSRLREQDWGDWVGLTAQLLYQDFPEAVAEQEAAGWDFRPPAGESRRDVLHRGREAFFDAARRWPGETILIVSHGGMMKCIFYHLLEHVLVPTQKSMIKPYHLHWLTVQGDELTLQTLNAMALDTVPGHANPPAS